MKSNFKFAYIAILLFAATNISHASKCEKIEFAELQSMRENELTGLYCNNAKTIENLSSEIITKLTKRNEISQEATDFIRKGNTGAARSADQWSEKYGKEADEYASRRDQCYEENRRILRLINNKNNSNKEPNCK